MVRSDQFLSRLTRPHGGQRVAVALACLAICIALVPSASAASLSKPTAQATTTSTTSGTNLLTGKEATFNGSTGGWTGIDSTLSWASAPSTTGYGSLAMTATASSWVEAWSDFPPNGPATLAQPGEKLSGGASVYETGASEPLDVVLGFLNSAGSVIATVSGQLATPATGTWTSLPAVAGIAPTSSVAVAVGVIQYSASVGQVTYIESPILATIGAGSPAVVGPLHTTGNKVVQANGKSVVLKGVVLEGLESSGTLAGTGVTEDAVQQAKSWGANFVRVPLGEQFWLSSNCDYSASYQSAVDQVVSWITSLGMVALLDLHTNTLSACETGGQHDMADEAQSPIFWNQVAGRYGNPSSPEYNSLVAFDLYNEPHHISDSVWLNGGLITDLYGSNETFEAAGMQQLYNTVRAAGSQNVVFISGTNWANNPPSQLVSGTNIVYAVHYYTCPHSAPPNCLNANPYDPSQDLNLWLPLSGTKPVAVTEFGWPSDTDGTYTANVVSYAKTQGWGWSAYAWEQEPGWGGFVYQNWLSDGTAEPKPSGTPILLALSQG